ncbi:MAG: amidophosphoribosyltransferase [Brevinematales bacterium]|nr:amidophosphoribosyltransferase [Brevinematales bacterium]
MLKEECGIFGIYGIPEASRYVYLGLNFLQHRGQEACGIVSTDGRYLYKQVGLGKVTDFFDEEKISYLEGTKAIGHVRYSTTGSSTLINAQPISAVTSKGAIAIAHNGNITNASEIRESLIKKGKIFHSTSDSEVILHLISDAPFEDIVNSCRWAFRQLEGAYSLLILTRDFIIAARDPLGFRPLSMGYIGSGLLDEPETIVFSSEDSAFTIVEATKRKDVNPNEMVVCSQAGINFMKIVDKESEKKQCVFELIYFSKPSSVVFDKLVYDFRFKIGEILAKEFPVEADYVIPVPDSGIVAALGYSKYSGIPFAMGLIRSHYIGRTFIEPSQKIRDFGVKMKFIPVRELIEGKRIVLIDDSIVRGTTSKKIIKMVRSLNPKEIHFRVASPPVKNPCFYGIDFSTREELLANKLNTFEEIAEFIGADSVGYISVESMFENTGINKKDFCKACFDGLYPTKLREFKKEGFENDIKQDDIR